MQALLQKYIFTTVLILYVARLIDYRKSTAMPTSHSARFLCLKQVNMYIGIYAYKHIELFISNLFVCVVAGQRPNAFFIAFNMIIARILTGRAVATVIGSKQKRKTFATHTHTPTLVVREVLKKENSKNFFVIFNGRHFDCYCCCWAAPIA